ncbi:MAG TPA: cold shock domain-containing protein [Planctomycetota bacterium]|nr:cold shock domain-containing protein [Planctomycetota bacterium]
MRGRVKWFDNARGHGFLLLDDGREVFVHFKDVAGGRGFVALRQGEEVECEVREGGRGLHAADVRRRAR